MPKETWFDSHCHLTHPLFPPHEVKDVLARARAAGVEEMLTVGYQMESSRAAVAVAESETGVFAAVGISPHDAAHYAPEHLTELRSLLGRERVVALGEIGLDYFRKLSPREIQLEVFRLQLRLAKELNQPVLLHLRDAADDFFLVLDDVGLPAAGGVLHCFTGELAQAQAGLERGLHISFSGILTFQKTHLRELIQRIPLERLLIETDAPYLAPHPYRGQRCEPSMVVEVGHQAAECLGLGAEDLARLSRVNAQRLLGLSPAAPPQLVYAVHNKLYLNITNRCANACVFCLREIVPEYLGYNLRLDHEPAGEEILRAVAAMGGPKEYPEVVFCGFGEPACRLPVLLEVAGELHRRGYRVRLDTSGLGNLINGRDIIPELVGKVDAVSVSLNTASAEQYAALCRPSFGAGAFPAVVEFIRAARAAGLETMASVVELAEVDVDAVRKLCAELGVPLRVRPELKPASAGVKQG